MTCSHHPFSFHSFSQGINFPDTVVEVGVAKNAAGEDYYTWALEFQCVEVFNHIVFVGINFYSREKEDKYAQEMLAASEKYGLHQWVTEDQLKIVDHTNCTYPGDDIFTAYEKETLKGGSSAYPLFTTKVLGLDPERNHEEREESGDGDSDSTVKITSV